MSTTPRGIIARPGGRRLYPTGRRQGMSTWHRPILLRATPSTTAISYYGDYRDEVDAEIALNEEIVEAAARAQHAVVADAADGQVARERAEVPAS
jgi:hypothetical protein